MAPRPTILVVDDERELADLYASWVGEEYDVLTAYDGTSALEQVSEAVDVVLLDRRMPDLSGDAVLREIRSRGYDCWVIMVTAVDPGLDVVELDIDDYVLKPVTRAQLTRIIENLHVKSRYDGRRTLSSISKKMDALDDEATIADVRDTEEYRRLEEELSALGETLSSGVDGE